MLMFLRCFFSDFTDAPIGKIGERTRTTLKQPPNKDYILGSGCTGAIDGCTGGGTRHLIAYPLANTSLFKGVGWRELQITISINIPTWLGPRSRFNPMQHHALYSTETRYVIRTSACSSSLCLWQTPLRNSTSAEQIHLSSLRAKLVRSLCK